MKRPGKRELRKHIKASGGTITHIAEAYGVTPQTVYNWLDYFKMRKEVQQARSDIVELAQDVIYDSIMINRDVETSKWVLARKARHLGYGNTLEHSGVVGQMIFTDADLELIQSQGLDVQEVISHFVGMLRESAERDEDED